MIVFLCVAVVLFLQQNKILFDTYDMTEKEFIKYVRDNHIMD